MLLLLGASLVDWPVLLVPILAILSAGSLLVVAIRDITFQGTRRRYPERFRQLTQTGD